LPEPDSDLAADMYEWGDEELMRHGFEQYEISSWKKSQNPKTPTSKALESLREASNLQLLITNYECKHNLQYWHNDPYLGLGAGAHGYVNGHRYLNVMSPTAYINRMDGSPKSSTSGKVEDFAFQSPAMSESIPIDRKTEMDETMLTGMRLTKEGVSFERFRKRFGVEIGDVFAKELKELEERKLIEVDDERVRLTKGGRLVANWVFEKFV